MKLVALIPRWAVALLIVVAVLEQVHGGDCASDKQRKSGVKKVKNKNNYKSLLRTLVMNDGLQDSKPSGGEKNIGNRLMKSLFGDYNHNIRPVLKPTDPVKVGFGISIIEILDLNTDNGHAKLHTWVKMRWTDENLVWDPKDYDGMSEVHVPAKMLWLPDITLYNNAESENPINQDMNAVVERDGSVTWVAPATFHITCKHEFRGNAWSCPMRFASWTFDGFQMDIIPFQGQEDIDTSEYLMSDYFSLLDHKGKREERTFPGDDGTPYPSMTYLMKIRNKIGPSLLGK